MGITDYGCSWIFLLHNETTEAVKMTGRDMDKARKETIYCLIGLLALMAWIIFCISSLPKSTMPRDWYMSGLEMFMADMLALSLASVLVFIGIILGRFIESRQYQKNGRYLGKGVS